MHMRLSKPQSFRNCHIRSLNNISYKKRSITEGVNSYCIFYWASCFGFQDYVFENSWVVPYSLQLLHISHCPFDAELYISPSWINQAPLQLCLQRSRQSFVQNAVYLGASNIGCVDFPSTKFLLWEPGRQSIVSVDSSISYDCNSIDCWCHNVHSYPRIMRNVLPSNTSSASPCIF